MDPQTKPQSDSSAYIHGGLDYDESVGRRSPETPWYVWPLIVLVTIGIIVWASGIHN